MGTLIKQSRDDRQVRDVLEKSFDFMVSDAESAQNIGWFRVEPQDRVELIASDASGGVFLLYGEAELLIYISSEGQAGVVANTLRQLLTILVTYPYWSDLLNFSAGGKLEEMRSAVEPREAQALDYAPHLDQHRRLLSSRLGLKRDPTVISVLHAAVRDLGREVRIFGLDGSEFRSLFNKFEAARLRPPGRKP